MEGITVDMVLAAADSVMCPPQIGPGSIAPAFADVLSS
jgi:hypothetical protein